MNVSCTLYNVRYTRCYESYVTIYMCVSRANRPYVLTSRRFNCNRKRGVQGAGGGRPCSSRFLSQLCRGFAMCGRRPSLISCHVPEVTPENCTSEQKISLSLREALFRRASFIMSFQMDYPSTSLFFSTSNGSSSTKKGRL